MLALCWHVMRARARERERERDEIQCWCLGVGEGREVLEALAAQKLDLKQLGILHVGAQAVAQPLACDT